MGRPGTSELLAALGAPGPRAVHGDELMLFGQFVGAWDLEIVLYDLDGGIRAQGSGEWLFGWVLEGRAVQDVLVRPPRAQRGSEEPTEFWEYGTTMRVYDAATGTWRITWFAPARGGELRLVARADGDEIVLDSVDRDPLAFRWVFSEIAPDSFLWRGSGSDDDGATWLLLQEMRATRRRPASA
jgi:hypothetical protein